MLNNIYYVMRYVILLLLLLFMSRMDRVMNEEVPRRTGIERECYVLQRSVNRKGVLCSTKICE